jgi:hypothetical protein
MLNIFGGVIVHAPIAKKTDAMKHTQAAVMFRNVDSGTLPPNARLTRRLWRVAVEALFGSVTEG